MQFHENHWLPKLLNAWIRSSIRFRWPIVVASVLLSMLAIKYTIRHLGVSTDTKRLVSAELEFRKLQTEYEKIFPQLENTLLFMVDSKSPEVTDAATAELVARLDDRPEQFVDVFAASQMEFFRTNGLLFRDMDYLETLTDNLSEAQPFVAKISRDPSLRGLFGTMGDALEEVLKGRDLDLEQMLQPMADTLKRDLAGEPVPLSWREIMAGEDAEDERHQYVLAKLDLNFSTFLPAKPAIDFVKSVEKDLKAEMGEDVRIRVTGDLALNFEELQSLKGDVSNAGVMSLVFVSLIMLFGLRSIRLSIYTLITLLVGLIFTAAFAAASIGHLNMISIAFAVLYIGMGVDYAIHVCLRYRELVGAGRPSEAALRESIEEVGVSLVLCALTTSLGFFVFVPTDFKGVSELGIISGMGMIISLVVTMTLMPALLTISPLSPKVAAPRSSDGDAKPGLGERIMARSREICWLTGIAAVIAIPLLSGVAFNYDPLELRDQASESVVTIREILELKDGGAWEINVLSDDTEEVERLSEEIKKLDTVERVISILKFVPEGQDDKLDLIDELVLILGPDITHPSPAPPPEIDEEIAAGRKLVGQLELFIDETSHKGTRVAATALRENLMKWNDMVQSTTGPERILAVTDMRELLVGTLSEALAQLNKALNAQDIGIDDISAKLRDRWVTADGTYRIEVQPSGDAGDVNQLRKFVDDVRGVTPRVAGESIMRLEMGDTVISSFKQAFLSAIIAVFLVLIIILKNLKDSLLVLAPLLLAGAFTGAATAVLDIDFNFANVITLPLLLGMGVDSGIHMVHRIRQQGTYEGSILGSSTARGVFLSALTTILSFGNLSFVAHNGVSSMGQMLSIGIFFTLICSLIVLPAMVQTANPKTSAPETDQKG